MLTLDFTHTKDALPPDWLAQRMDALAHAHASLEAGSGPGGAFTGWLRLPERYDHAEFSRIQAAAAQITRNCDALVVIGIGGSYLGARAVIDLLASPRYNERKKDTPNIYFAGNTLSTDATLELIELLGDRDFSINVISKSGTTTEPAVAFRVFRDLLEKKYGPEGAARRIYATTDGRHGALKALADAKGYETFVVPDDIGGRFSVLSAVGLLPIAVAGIDIEALMDGAAAAMTALSAQRADNPAWQYAAVRHALCESGKTVELLTCFEPSFRFFAEWWKQLYGESEGKGGKGLFPASVEFTADLHSMGQYIQDGPRTLFETAVHFVQSRGQLSLPGGDDGDGLGFLAGQSLDFVNRQALRGTLLAHADGGVPTLLLTLPQRDARAAGYLLYFFELACGLSGSLLGVNPFDQPGVEAYKKNMFALLGRPGYEAQRALLEDRLKK